MSISLERILNGRDDYTCVERVYTRVSNRSEQSIARGDRSRMLESKLKKWLLNRFLGDFYTHDLRYYEPYIYFMKTRIYIYNRDIEAVRKAINAIWKSYDIEYLWTFIYEITYLDITQDRNLLVDITENHKHRQGSSERKYSVKLYNGKTYFGKDSWFQYWKTEDGERLPGSEDGWPHVVDHPSDQDFESKTWHELQDKLDPWPFWTIDSMEELSRKLPFFGDHLKRFKSPRDDLREQIRSTSTMSRMNPNLVEIVVQYCDGPQTIYEKSEPTRKQFREKIRRKMPYMGPNLVEIIIKYIKY